MQKSVLISMTICEFTELIREVVRSEIQNLNRELPKVNDEKYYSRCEVAKLLSISLGSLNKYVKNGDVPAKRLGNKVIFLKSDVEASLKSIETLKHSRKREY